MGKLAISHQAEGMMVKRLEEKSAEMSGRSMDGWRKAVLDKMQAGDKSMQAAGKLLADKNWTGANPKVPADPGAFSQLVGNSYVSAHDGLPSSHAMMKGLGKDLIYDTDWQPNTTVSYVVRYTGDDAKAKTIPKGQAIGDVKTSIHVDPETQPGIVARDGVDGGIGSFARVGDASNPLRYAQVLDAPLSRSSPSQFPRRFPAPVPDLGLVIVEEYDLLSEARRGRCREPSRYTPTV